MAKFYGEIGYVETSEIRPGVWQDQPVERKYRGDVTRNIRKYDAASDRVNDNLNLNNMLSIVADAYANQHFFAMKYIKWMGAYWTITNVEVQRPRLILTIGGVYNGPKVEPAQHP